MQLKLQSGWFHWSADCDRPATFHLSVETLTIPTNNPKLEPHLLRFVEAIGFRLSNGDPEREENDG